MTYTYRCRRCLNAAFHLNAAGVCARCAGVDVRDALADVRVAADAALYALEDEHEAGVRREVHTLKQLVDRIAATVNDW